MPVAIKGSGGGSVTLDAGAASATTTLTLPNVTGTVALTASPTFSGTVTATTVTSPASTALTIQSAGTTAMTVSTSRNVGIGTTSPAQLLDIEKVATDVQLRMGDASGNYYDIGRNTSTGLLTFYGSQAVAAGYDFYTSAAGGNYVRIDSSGNLLVGTTAQLNGSYGSKVNVQAGANNGIAVASSAANWSALVVLNGSNALIGYLNATQSNISLVNVSDYRLKKNVAPMITGLNAVKALKPVTYDWTNSDESGEGFIAHELQNVIPHAVTGEKDAVNEDGSIKPQGVDYSKIVVHLVAAIQEISAKNDALEAANAAFEARLAALEAK
jgi:hypothetical protein